MGCHTWFYRPLKEDELIHEENKISYRLDDKDELFVEANGYHDIFRLYGYPSVTVHNLFELKRLMGDQFSTLNKEQIDKISKFFKKHPDGIITFG